MGRYVLSIVIIPTVLILIGGYASADHDEDIPHNEVRNWALRFGVDLWEFGRHFTKINEIKKKYRDMEFEVVRKDGFLLLREMAAEVKNFMDFKMNAIMRVMDSAEQALSESDRDGSQSHNGNGYYDARHINEYSSDGSLAEGSRRMILRKMREFEGLPVNLSLSTILVPSTVDLENPEILSAIAWSSHLDPIFASNLERDSALAWQYFGSSKGFMRRFPGTAWPPDASKRSKFINDFRTDDWFIQATSSPKDIMILLDASSSMNGKDFDLGIKTASVILDTLTDDDFVNLVVFSETTKSVVPCFNDKMVRATPDNVKELKAAARSIECENSVNFTAGFEYAFELLHRYNITNQGSQCNQAIMLITNKISDTHTEIIKKYNWPHMPVRIFTYLIGGGSSSSGHMHDIACGNKGFFAKINSEQDVARKIIEYALVMARPMVLYQSEHPVHWSPVFLGGHSSKMNVFENKRRLVTTVSTPVFDRRNHSSRVANLLGVVGIDVSIEDIQKMIPQYKLGANGYSFILDNNGGVLYHPDLRIMLNNDEYVEFMKPKYSSVDITEIELPESDGISDRDDENSHYLMEMRNQMVQQKEGESELSVLSHLDDMKRISSKNMRYFYGPIEGTPFSLALALPSRYGLHELISQQEIRHARQNVTEYFKGDKWKVNPNWVYCEYTLYEQMRERENAEDQFGDHDYEPPYNTPEEQVLHFLTKAGRPGWKWMSVRPRSPSPQSNHHGHGIRPPNENHFNHLNPNQNFRKSEPYYCDRNLLQSLVRDAMVTEDFDKTDAPFLNKGDNQQGYQRFVAKLSFIATRSGLLRWVDHKPHSEDSAEPHFSDLNSRAFDMSWYQRAVDQYLIEPDSFVYSVPFDSGYTENGNTTLVTATHAIFLEHRGHKSPAAVVGIQFEHDSLARHFINITSACTGSTGCPKNCASQDLDCYLLDNNGFVILSENSIHTGKFFGQIDGTIMDSLVQDRIYRRVGLFDHQGICSGRDTSYTAGSYSINVLKPVMKLFKNIVSLFVTWITMLPEPTLGWQRHEAHYDSPEIDFMDEQYADYEDTDEYLERIAEMEITTPPIEKPTASPKPSPIPMSEKITSDSKNVRTCDLKRDLYVLQPQRLNTSMPLKGKLTNCHSTGCERPFSVQKIPHSNLILLVVDTLCPCDSKQLDIEAAEIPGGACGTRRLEKERLPRKRAAKCINYHPEESEIQQCGRGARLFNGLTVLFAHIALIIPIWIFSRA